MFLQKGRCMKHFWKIGAALSIVLFFGMANVWVNAVDVWGTYQNAKDSVAGAYQRTRDAAVEMRIKRQKKISFMQKRELQVLFQVVYSG